MTLNLKDSLRQIEDHRFANIIDALTISDICSQCDFFNRSINDPKLRYRCHCMGSRIDATLHDDMILYLNKKLGWIK
jgi:hypothetical protein